LLSYCCVIPSLISTKCAAEINGQRLRAGTAKRGSGACVEAGEPEMRAFLMP
jgi:hypothetical protein